MPSNRTNYRRVVAENVAALKLATPSLKSDAKLAAMCSTATRKIGSRTISHLTNPEGPQPQLDTMVAVAEAFRLPPWLLLMPDFDAKLKGVPDMPAPEIIELARRIAALDPARRELLMQIFGDAVTDEELHANGYKAPAQAPSVHEPAPTYKKPPKQLKMRLRR